MSWILVAVLIIDQEIKVMPLAAFETMAVCFEAREVFVSTAPVPKINYEAVCIRTDQVESA